MAGIGARERAGWRESCEWRAATASAGQCWQTIDDLGLIRISPILDDGIFMYLECGDGYDIDGVGARIVAEAARRAVAHLTIRPGCHHSLLMHVQRAARAAHDDAGELERRGERWEGWNE